MRRHAGWLAGASIGMCLAAYAAAAGEQRGPAVAATDRDAVATLLRLEDTRQFDEETLTRLAKAPNPEVRRRAIVSIGRIVNPAGRGILASLRQEQDPELAATVVFATGQIKDADAVSWLGGLLADKRPAVATEAARALGKIRTPEARTQLARFLTETVTTSTAPAVSEALFSMGRFTTRDDVAPIVRWTTSRDAGIRWRAAWALYRPRNPAAVATLLTMSTDPSPEVRFWALRGLAPALVTEAGLDLAKTSARLREAVRDSDRRVRTEAMRTLVLYDDDASVAVVLEALESSDSWLSVSSAEALGRLKARASTIVPKLVAAGAPAKPTALRLSALTSLVALDPAAAADLAFALASDKRLASSTYPRVTAVQVLQKLGTGGQPRLDALAADPATKDLVVKPAAPGARPAAPTRTEEDYKRLADRWVVPAMSGVAPPRAILTTPRGQIEIELYPGDAPLGVEFFVHTVESGSIVGTEFGRVVPNFVAQQRPIRDAVVLRDEVNRRGLTRGNLSWASSGLDTGRPGYTLGSTPQPHNEGDFTALGRVVSGIDVVDRLELGDAITAARMVK